MLSQQQTYYVGDLATKDALILAGVGWGNLPLWLVEDDLTAGRLAQVALAVRRSHQTERLPFYIIWAFGPPASDLCHMLTGDFRASGQLGE